MKEEDLPGRMVIVSPAFWISDRAGEVGIVTSSELSDDNVWVKFGDEEIERFHPNVLFQFKTPAELKLIAAIRSQEGGKPINLFLQQIALVQEFGTNQQLVKAYNEAGEDPELFQYATIRISESVEPEYKRRIGR